VQVHYDEGVAIYIGPEPCVGVREDGDEASVGEGIAIEPRKPRSGCRRCFEHGRQHEQAHHRERLVDPAWSKNLACADALCAGTGRSRDRPFGNRRRSASGRRGAVADDARSREVRLCHSSCEADEQSRATSRGAGGAKGGGQGECEPAKHAPDSEPGKRVTRAGAHTANRKGFAVTPKVGAVCPNWACTDLCGGRSVMSVPTAIGRMLALAGIAAIFGAIWRRHHPNPAEATGGIFCDDISEFTLAQFLLGGR